MTLTRNFTETIRQRATEDEAFRAALLSQALELLLTGDVETGRAVLRDFINVTIGFEKLSDVSGIPAKSLMRMFGPKGNPRTDNLFSVLTHLQAQTGIQLEVRAA